MVETKEKETVNSKEASTISTKSLSILTKIEILETVSNDQDKDDHQSLESISSKNNPVNKKYKQWILNMSLVNFVEFTAESARGMTLPSMYSYILSIGGASKEMGFAVAMFSIGRFLSSFLLGWISDRISFRATYMIASFISICGQILYILSDRHITNSISLLYFSRFTIGFGAGSRSVCRSNVAHLSHPEHRLHYVTILSTVIFIGYAVTPVVGMWFEGIHLDIQGFPINPHTIPGYILVILNTIVFLMILFGYRNGISAHDGPRVETHDATTPNDIVPLSPADAIHHEPKSVKISIENDAFLYRIGFAIFFSLNFVARGLLAAFETIATPLLLDAMDLKVGHSNTVDESAEFHFYLGIAGIVTFILLDQIRFYVAELYLLTFGFIIMGFGNLVLIPNQGDRNIWQIILGEGLVWSIGSPIVSAVVISSFSKILGSKPQGTWMGLIGSAGSLARIILPIGIGLLKSHTITFIINTILCLLAIFAVSWYSQYVRKIRLKKNAEIVLEQISSLYK